MSLFCSELKVSSNGLEIIVLSEKKQPYEYLDLFFVYFQQVLEWELIWNALTSINISGSFCGSGNEALIEFSTKSK